MCASRHEIPGTTIFDGAQAQKGYALNNREFDLEFMDSLTKDPVWATGYSTRELAEFTGSQGVELMMWLTARATLLGEARRVTANYHIPISSTASGLMLLVRAE